MMYFILGYGVAKNAAPTAEALHEIGMTFVIALGFALAMLAAGAAWHWATGPHAPRYTDEPGPR